MNIKNKIGYIENKKIPKLKNIPGGHYVYIRDVYSTKCTENTITSLEYHNGKFKNERIKNIKKGNIYPIPKKDSNFQLWSGVSFNPIKNVKIKDIKDIGKKKIKKRHRFFINKFLNKKRY